MRTMLSLVAWMTVVMAVAACSDGGDAGSTGGSAGSGGAGASGGATTEAGGASSGGTAGSGGTASTGGSGGSGAQPTGCETAGSEPVSFANDVQPIFQTTCGGAASNCHFKASPSGTLPLATAKSHPALVNVKSDVTACNQKTFVVPGNAAESYLLDKLIETGKPEICGVRMPYEKAKLPDADIQTIVAWICQGALDN